MNRRHFVFTAATFGLLGGCGVLPNLGKPATPRVPRVGILNGALEDDSQANDEITGLKQRLTELGYVDGHTIVFERRDAASKFEVLPDLASDLIRLPVDVMVTLASLPTLAAQQATGAVPIVFVNVTDPVTQGIVTGLNHPGANLTGVSDSPATLLQKKLEFLNQLVPGLSRVGVILNLSTTTSALRFQAILPAANAMGVQLKTLDMRSAKDVAPALAGALAWQAQAIINFDSPGPPKDAYLPIVDFALQNRLPLACGYTQEVQAGALVYYDTSQIGVGRTAAALVDKIIKGARPADLPVEQPDTFELIINQTTAQAFGLTIPPEVAQQVSEWVK